MQKFTMESNMQTDQPVHVHFARRMGIYDPIKESDYFDVKLVRHFDHSLLVGDNVKFDCGDRPPAMGCVVGRCHEPDDTLRVTVFIQVDDQRDPVAAGIVGLVPCKPVQWKVAATMQVYFDPAYPSGSWYNDTRYCIRHVELKRGQEHAVYRFVIRPGGEGVFVGKAPAGSTIAHTPGWMRAEDRLQAPHIHDIDQAIEHVVMTLNGVKDEPQHNVWMLTSRESRTDESGMFDILADGQRVRNNRYTVEHITVRRGDQTADYRLVARTSTRSVTVMSKSTTGWWEYAQPEAQYHDGADFDAAIEHLLARLNDGTVKP